MTEKTRFIYKDNSMWFSFIDRQTGKHLNAIMCCNLMNELHEENEQLKHDATVLICSNQEYRKENEQLKSELSEKDIQLDFLKAENSHMSNLVNENKQLKQLAEGNEELLLKVMSYLHDNHYDIWEEVNKECFLKELGDD